MGSTFVGLVVQSLVMGGLFGLNKQPTLSTLSFIFAGVILLPFLYMRRRFPRVTEHGSLVETTFSDAEKGGEEQITAKLARLYHHPGMAPLPDPVPNESGLTEEQLKSIAVTAPASAAKKSVDPGGTSPRSPTSDIENALASGAVESVAATDAICIDSGIGNPKDGVEIEPAFQCSESDGSVYLDAR